MGTKKHYQKQAKTAPTTMSKTESGQKGLDSNNENKIRGHS